METLSTTKAYGGTYNYPAHNTKVSGFDVASAPSSAQMSAAKHSYSAIGIDQLLSRLGLKFRRVG